MSKTITVPDIGQYPIHIRINQTEYTLTPGATVTVPDEVAAMLARIVAAQPAPDPDGWKDAAATLGDIDSAVELPVVSTTDNGKLLGVSGGKWAKIDAPSGLPAVTAADNGSALVVDAGAWSVGEPRTVTAYAVNGTVDLETGTTTLSCTVNDLMLNAIGRPVLVQLEIGSDTIYIFAWMTIQQAGDVYDVSFVGPDGGVYVSGHLSATDTVVLAPAS